LTENMFNIAWKNRGQNVVNKQLKSYHTNDNKWEYTNYGRKHSTVAYYSESIK